MASHKIGELTDFPEGEGIPVEIEGVKIAVLNVDGDIYAIQDNCPHKNLPLHLIGSPKFRSGEERNQHYSTESTSDPDSIDRRGSVNCSDGSCKIECPWHGLEIDLETGYSPVRKHRIPTYDVFVDDEGSVIVTI